MNNLSMFIPIKTGRLILIKTTVDDIDLIMKMDKQELTQKFLGGIKNKTKEERIEFLKKKESRTSSLTVTLLDGTKIGFTGLDIHDDNTATIGYIFDSDYCNNGYCTEACKKIIELGFSKLNLKTIYADTVKGNNSSIRVLEKLGFIYQDSTFKDSIEFLNYRIDK